jgi:hypothetical protein
MSFQGRFAEATHECLRAIEIDAEFGKLRVTYARPGSFIASALG